MNRSYRLFFSLMLFVPVLGFAKDSNLERGGLGFLFPDHNSFANPGQFAVSHGIAVQGAYGTDTKVANPQTGNFNAVFGNGTFGMGAGVNRTAPNVLKSQNASDFVLAGAGVALLKERLTLGGSYSRMVSAGADGSALVQGTLTLNSPGRKGPSIGVGYSQLVNSAFTYKAVTAGIGYQFHSQASVEGNVYFNDTSDWSNYDAGLFFTTGAGMMYAGGGYLYHAVAKQHEVSGRIGFVFGQRFDVSATIGHTFASGNPINYGATARIAF